eukprot:gene8433-16151_t
MWKGALVPFAVVGVFCCCAGMPKQGWRSAPAPDGLRGQPPASPPPPLSKLGCGDKDRTGCGDKDRTGCGDKDRSGCGDKGRFGCGDKGRFGCGDKGRFGCGETGR